MKKIAIYARVSTERQEEQKTIESQLAELREICKDFQVIGEYKDEGYSGEILARPELDRLRDDAAKGLFEAVYIHSPDRLARKYIYQGLVIEELTKKGIEIVFLNKPVSNNPEDQLLLGVQGLIAEYEKTKIIERTRRGRIYKASQKGIVGTVPPFGYDYVKKNNLKEGFYKINKKEAGTVKFIFESYLRLQSLGRVVKELSLENIKTRNGYKKWSRGEIGRILKREEYIGTGYYRKRYSVEVDNGIKYKKAVKTGRRLRNRKEWIPLKFPPILKEDIFKSVQFLLSKRYKPYGASKYFYLLSGLMRCKNCGATYSGDNTNGHFYYRCNNRHKTFPFPRECKARMVDREKIESAIWRKITEAISNPQIIVGHLINLVSKINESEPILRNKKLELLKEKERLDYKMSKLLDVYTGGEINKEQFLEKSNEFKIKVSEIDENVKEIDNKLTNLLNRPLILKDIKYFCSLAKQRLGSLKPEDKKTFLRLLIDAIVFDSDKKTALVSGQIPLEKSGIEQMFVPKVGIESLLSQNASVRTRHLLLLL